MHTKTCSTCGETKPISEFHKGKRYKDGYRGQCKKCTHEKQKAYNQTPKGRRIQRKATKKWQGENEDRRKTYRRWWYYEYGGREYFQQHRQTERGKEIARRSVRRYRQTDKYKEGSKEYAQNNPEKISAKAAVNNAVKSGEIPHIGTQACNRCGAQAEHYHHWSYKEKHWLDVEPLCLQCHVDHHRERGEPIPPIYRKS